MPGPNNSGTVPFYSMDGPLKWMGADVEDVGEFYAGEVALADTDFNGWTPSSTAKTCKATVSLSPTYAARTEEYEYLINWLVDIPVVYSTTPTGKGEMSRYTAALWQNVHRRPYGIANFETMNHSYNYCANLLTASNYTFYKNASGTSTWTSGISYGLYVTSTTASLSNTTSTTPNITFRTPVIMARTASTYMNATNMGYVDQDDTIVRIRGHLYRAPADFSVLRNGYDKALEVYNNPIPLLEP